MELTQVGQNPLVDPKREFLCCFHNPLTTPLALGAQPGIQGLVWWPVLLERRKPAPAKWHGQLRGCRAPHSFSRWYCGPQRISLEELLRNAEGCQKSITSSCACAWAQSTSVPSVSKPPMGRNCIGQEGGGRTPVLLYCWWQHWKTVLEPKPDLADPWAGEVKGGRVWHRSEQRTAQEEINFFEEAC